MLMTYTLHPHHSLLSDEFSLDRAGRWCREWSLPPDQHKKGFTKVLGLLTVAFYSSYSLQQMCRSQHEHFPLSSMQSRSCLTLNWVPFHCCYSKPHSLLRFGCLAAVLDCILYQVSSSSYSQLEHQDISLSVESNHMHDTTCQWRLRGCLKWFKCIVMKS